MYETLKDTVSKPDIDKSNDLYTAYKENLANLQKFKETNEYKNWIAGKDAHELMF